MHLLFSKVFHKRFIPTINHFTYGVYYWVIPIEKETKNKKGIISFHLKDHGPKDGSCLYSWFYKIITPYIDNKKIYKIDLICMPRLFGYGFNPVSFWIAYDDKQNPLIILAEVNNTFGETHLYLILSPKNQSLSKENTISIDKVFHVSPFLQRQGDYQFRFDIQSETIAIYIDFYNEKKQRILATSIHGKYKNNSYLNHIYAFFRYPLLSFKVIFLIHFQALKLFLKGVKYIRKPKQKMIKITRNTE